MVEKVSNTSVVTDLVERPGTAVGALGTHRDAKHRHVRGKVVTLCKVVKLFKVTLCKVSHTL